MTSINRSALPRLRRSKSSPKGQTEVRPALGPVDDAATGGASPSRGWRPRWPVDLDPVPVVTESVAIVLALTLTGAGDPLAATVFSVICLAAAGTYRRRLVLSALDVAPRVAVATAVGATIAEITVGRTADMRAVLAVSATACVAAVVGRSIAYVLERRLRRLHLDCRRTVVVGADAVGLALARQMLDDPEYGLIPVALLDDWPSPSAAEFTDLRIRRLNGSLSAAIAAEAIQTAVIAFPQTDEVQLVDLIRGCDRLGCKIFVVPRLWETVAVNGKMDRIGAIPLEPIRHPTQGNPAWYAKLCVERTLAAIAIVTALPLLAVLAVIVKMSDRSAPVLFRQTRVGFGGDEFDLLKFRSMSPSNELESQTNWTIAGDPRVGPVGRLLRASSLDELPQLWNIVRGDMTLVGPRPERPHFVEKFSASIPGYTARHRVPAGLTGWAAVNGLSGDTSIVERARYDNFYITNWSLWLDVRIVIRTLWVLIKKARLEKRDVGRERLGVGQSPCKAVRVGNLSRRTVRLVLPCKWTRSPGRRLTG